MGPTINRFAVETPTGTAIDTITTRGTIIGATAGVEVRLVSRLPPPLEHRGKLLHALARWNSTAQEPLEAGDDQKPATLEGSGLS